MDELKANLADAVKDMTVQQVADAITASSKGALVEDPLVLAAYLKSLG